MDSATAQLKPADIWRDADAAKDYLDHAAAELAAAKEQLDVMLKVRAGSHVLDVGCGTGNDVRALAARVGPSGRVVGLDSSEQLIARGEPGGPDSAPVEFVLGEAGDLPFDDGTFDVARAERVLQHVPDPAAAVAEMLRVIRPGGQVLVTDPDHGMWAPDMDDRRLTRRIMDWWSEHIPNPWVARRLRDLFVRAGAREVEVTLQPVVLASLAAADTLTLIGRAAAAAGAQGVVPAAQARAWGEEVVRRDREGRFLMFGTFVVVTGTK
jgi:ubiquinone/menaquinone biosynthesis C-methylase UbiE